MMEMVAETVLTAVALVMMVVYGDGEGPCV